jgi:hypothetical protein
VYHIHSIQAGKYGKNFEILSPQYLRKTVAEPLQDRAFTGTPTNALVTHKKAGP